MAHNTGWSPEETGEELEERFEAPPESHTFSQLAHSLIEDGRSYARAEADRQKLRASIISSAARDAALLAAIGLFLLLGTLVALLVGLIWALAPHWGPLPATGIVIGVALAAIIALLLTARSRLRRAIQIAFPKEDG